MMRSSQRKRRMLDSDADDPMNMMGNLFDIAMVFSVALMVALVSYLGVSDMLFSDSFTMVKNPGQENMEIITKEDGEIVRYSGQTGESNSSQTGKRVGTAYQLENGEIIYMPDE